MAAANTTEFIAAYKFSIIASLHAVNTIVEIKSITAIQARREMLALGVKIVATVRAPNVAVTDLSSRLNNAIRNGTFTSVLASSGFPNARATATAAIVDNTPTSSPTTAPTTIEKKIFLLISDGAIVGISFGIAGLIAAIIVLTVCISIYCKRKTYIVENTVVIQSVGNDNLTDNNIIVMDRKTEGQRQIEATAVVNI